MRQRSPVLAILLGFSLCFAGCMTSAKVVYRDESATIYERASMLPHGTGARVLEVRGQTFRNLYSGRYAQVPEWNAIVFVTHREGGSHKFHCFDLQRREDLTVKIDPALGLSGSDLGQSRANLMTCYVDNVHGDTLVLVERRFKAPEKRYVFDRQTSRMTSQ
jgi:hypothetical protein